jgi:hypothetical protein
MLAALMPAVATMAVRTGAAITADTAAAITADFTDVPTMDTATVSALALVSGSAIRIMATVTDILTAIRMDTTDTIALRLQVTATATN